MEIQTRVFGTVEIDADRVVKLTEPLPGFPALRRFAVLDPDPESPCKWFQSVERPDVCFLIADPRTFFPDYELNLPAARLTDLELSGVEQAAVAVILTAGQDLSKTTANLLAPLVINADRGLARQIILEGSGHAVRARLFPDEPVAAAQAG